MYRGEQRIVGQRFQSLNAHIEGDDFFNSELIYRLQELPQVGTYTVTKWERRIDLIARELYEDEIYAPLIMIYNDIGILDITLGKELRLFKQSDLNDMLTI